MTKCHRSSIYRSNLS